MGYPKFSILMSLYIKEKAEYFDECMQSLINQTVMANEIVIVEDGPVSEEVTKVIEKYISLFPGLIRVISYEKNMGLGHALARGVIECRNELIARMDTDDVARADRFEIQLKEFIKDPALDICGSQIDEFEESLSKIVASRTVPLDDREIKKYQKRRDAFNHMTVMYKKEMVLKAGNYQTCLLMEDTLLWVNMILCGAKCKNVPDSLVYARIGRNMYERRGGSSYLKKYVHGRKQVLKTGYIGKVDYCYTVIIQFVVAIMPSVVRGWILKKILHGSEKRAF